MDRDGGLRLAFGITTIGDLAANDFVRAATAIARLAEVAVPPVWLRCRRDWGGSHE